MHLRPTVAIADDDPDQRDLFAAWLERRGYRVCAFSSGDDLLRWAGAGMEKADLLLLDVEMPGRNGFDSFRELKLIPDYAATPAVFVSAASEPSMEDEARSAGGWCVIRKDKRMLPRLEEYISAPSTRTYRSS